jgi:periplasmic divalent cation tolerance protein
MKTSLVYVTASGLDEARRIARRMVEGRLAACANIIPAIESIYHWEGRVETGAEAAVIFKTRTALVPELSAAVRALHSYQCPCVAAVSLSGGNPDFLKWIAAETLAPTAARRRRKTGTTTARKPTGTRG